jgi:hypothetical protein
MFWETLVVVYVATFVVSKIVFLYIFWKKDFSRPITVNNNIPTSLGEPNKSNKKQMNEIPVENSSSKNISFDYEVGESNL